MPKIGHFEKVGRDKNGHTLVVFVCSCGNIKIVRRDHVVNDHKIVSCGCYLKSIRGKATITHGNTRNRSPSLTYRSWQSMKRRCDNPKDIGYKYWGGRGITYCKRWNKFENFLKDMGERPLGKSIDRIDNDGNYEPSNCKWSTRSEQNKNQRRRRHE